MKFISFILCINIIAVVQAEFPSDITRCHFGDEKCIMHSIQDCIKRFGGGNAAIGLLPLNEVKLNNVTLLKAVPNAPMQVNLFYKNMTITKLDTAIIDRVVGFTSDIDNSKFEVYVRVPFVHVQGNYEASGKILLLPISGGGDSSFDLIEPKLSVRLKIKKESRGGKVYAKLVKDVSKLELTRINFNMKNLFRGNEEMSVVLNNLLNENWNDIWNEMKPTVLSIVSGIAKNILTGVLGTIPYEEMFLSD